MVKPVIRSSSLPMIFSSRMAKKGWCDEKVTVLPVRLIMRTRPFPFPAHLPRQDVGHVELIL